MSNHTCPIDRAPTDPVPFYVNGSINFKAHDVGWIICGFFSLIASCASFWLVWKHLTYYTCPQQQRHIVRMLFMVPIYAIVSTLSYVFYREAIYYQTIRDCYEAVVITSFFNLLLQYVGDTQAEQHEVFRQVKLKKWFFPLGFWKYRPDGLHFLWLMKVCILQYAIVRPVCTLVAVGLQYFNLYCLESWEPYFGHIWISLTISISVSVAMYCVIQFYLPITEELKPYKPVLKFLAVKSVVFLTFWQDSFLSILVFFGAIKQSKYMLAADIQVGINALLETFEMVLFAFIHIKAFTYLIYRPQDRARTTRRGRALLDVMDFRDWWYDMKRTTHYVAARSRGKDFTPVDDIRREKYLHLEKAMGKDRWDHLQSERREQKRKMPTFWKHEGDGDGFDLAADGLDLEKSSAATEHAPAEEKRPRGNRAMRSDYDPEKEDGYLDAEEPLLDSAFDRTDVRPAKASLPALTYNLGKVSDPGRDAHPELTQYHLAAMDAKEDDALDEEEDIFVPRKGGRARKEASLGLGAWWRAFRERVSGHGGEEGGEEEEKEGQDEEKRGMLADELGRGIALMKAERALEEAEELMPPVVRKGTDDSSTSSDASASVLQSRDSPLSLIINEHRRQEGERGGRGTAQAKIVTSLREKQVAAVTKDATTITRLDSTRAALDEEDRREGQRMGRVERMGLAMAAQAPLDASSIVPSISVAPSHSAPSTSMSTAELQRTQTQMDQSTSGRRGVGPKGKPIALVLPPPLSPNNFSDAPFSPAALPPVPVSTSVALSSASSAPRQSTKTGTSIRFAEARPVARTSRDDPEAEPEQRKGTVVVGGQSLRQAKAEHQQREKEQRRAQRDVARQGEQGQREHGHIPVGRPLGHSGHTSRQYGDPAPVQQPSNPNRPRSSWMGKKERSPEPYIPLPAPSQLAHSSGNNRQDPFAAAMFASPPPPNSATPITQRQERGGQMNMAGRGSYMQQQRRSSTAEVGARRPSLQVGSILSRQDVIDAAVAPLPPRQHRHRHLSTPLEASGVPQHHRPAYPHHDRTYEQARRPVRHSIGATARPAAVASYDRYNGEPAWEEDRQRQSRVEARRRQYEAPKGFQFDYID